MVFVLDTNKKPLSPCSEARARVLLKNKKAAVWKRYPFTIILKYEVKEDSDKYRLKIDLGSRHTGLSILHKNEVVWLGQIDHKTTISEDMKKRAAYRRRRRSTNLRYRKPRFLNRKKHVSCSPTFEPLQSEGWFAPTIISRIQNIETWTNRLMKLCPIKSISYELVHFDIQKLQNPEIEGKEYQEGPLFRTEMRSFLLSTYKGICQYCNGESKDTKMEWEHIRPRSRGGSNSLSNSTLACQCCNKEKDNQTPDEWLKDIKSKKKLNKLDLASIEGIKNVMKTNYNSSLRDAAISNAIRWKAYEILKAAGLPVECGSGGLTKLNRISMSLPKDHCIDAACVGRFTPKSLIFKTDSCLIIKASGRGKHCRTNVDKYGFPRGHLPRQKKFFGFQTGDIVSCNVPNGKKKGYYVGRVSCRKTGSFDIATINGRIQGINHKCFRILQYADGYGYESKNVFEEYIA